MDTLLGKVLRIDVDSTPDMDLNYHIPLDNPFQATPGAWGEIWAYGFRNPWSCSFDRVTERLICGDVGEALAEEIKYDLASFSPMHLLFAASFRKDKIMVGSSGKEASIVQLLTLPSKLCLLPQSIRTMLLVEMRL